MKVGVLTNILGSMPFESALDYLAKLGVQTVELGTGAFATSAHCPTEELLGSPQKAKAYKNAITSRGLSISGLSCHGNAVHPTAKIAADHHAAFERCIRLANILEVDVINTFSGCPGDSAGSKLPNWVTCPWPPDFLEILEWQWNEVVIPYWHKAAAFAKSNGIHKIAFEMHPGFVVYNPETLLRLRAAVGDILGANFDPSHLFWQGIDPCAALRALKGAVYHVHAKDTGIHEWNSKVNGVLDTKHYADEANRAWIFRTVGYGNPRSFWCDFVSTLRLIGYEGALSIEHEDSLMSAQEGLEKGIRFMREIVLEHSKGVVTWA